MRIADWNVLPTLLTSLHCYKQSKNPNSLTSRGFFKFFCNPAVFCLPAYLPSVRPTSARRKDPVFSHKKGDAVYKYESILVLKNVYA